MIIKTYVNNGFIVNGKFYATLSEAKIAENTLKQNTLKKNTIESLQKVLMYLEYSENLPNTIDSEISEAISLLNKYKKSLGLQKSANKL